MRITKEMMRRQMMHNVMRSRQGMEKKQYELSSGKKVRLPEDNPSHAAQAVQTRHRIRGIKQYQENIQNARDSSLTVYDTQLQSMMKITREMSTLAVQGANATYSAEDRRNMASRVNELLKEMVHIGNHRHQNAYIFAGHQVGEQPFQVKEAVPPGGDRAMITEVVYRGDGGEIKREIDQGHWMPVNVSGNRLHAINEHLEVNLPAGYTVPQDSKVAIDGRVVSLQAGDDLDAIVRRINAASTEVIAEREPAPNNTLRLVTRSPHEIQLRDLEGGSVFRDIGLLEPAQKRPNQVGGQVRRQGMSLFETAIKLRDDLLKNNINDIGSGTLQALRSAEDHLGQMLSDVGSRAKRLEHLDKRYEHTLQALQEELAYVENVNFEETITELMMHEFVNKSGLQAGARILQPTLMDFIR